MSNYTDKALDLFNKGFTTKSAQKESLRYLNLAFEVLRKKVNHDLLNRRDAGTISDDDMQPLYWLLPYDLHQFNEKKHIHPFNGDYAEIFEEMKYLKELRNTIKDAPIERVVSPEKEYKEKAEKIEKSLKELFEHAMQEYDRALRLAEIFGRVPVSVTPHYVHRDGGRFVRYFYFVNGKLTALNTIIAAMQTHAINQEKKEKNNAK